MKLRKNKFRLLLFAFTIASSIGIQAQQTLISVKLDTADILIGEQTTLNLTITTDKDRQVHGMPKIKLNEKQKKLDIDLWIITIVSFVSLGIFIVFQKEIYETIKNEELPILFRVLLVALFQYGLAGFGITIVCILRKEHFFPMG